MLARVRRALRAMNASIQDGSEHVGLTMQEQAVLLALAGHGGRRVPQVQVRRELDMDQATASLLLRRLRTARLILRETGADRRAADLSLTPRGWRKFGRSVVAIRAAMRGLERRGDLTTLDGDLARYLRFYLGGRAATRARRGSR